MKEFLLPALLILGFLTLTITASTANNSPSFAAYSGTVLDEFGDPVVEATVYATQAGTHDHTDALGRFTLERVTSTDSLRIQAIGYTTQLLPVGALDQPIQIRLEMLSVSLMRIEVKPESDAVADIADIDIATRPATNSQELLRMVPGLVIGQHAGGGKAEQLFFRGFDIDHGTDIAIDFDGMPVNIVSHAHGQGYADLHFVIPETVEAVDFTKGPYDVSRGNFATAASVSLSSKSRLRQNMLRTEAGQYGLARVVAMAELSNTKRQNTYGAIEYLRNDGPFESPQGFQRFNAFAKTTLQLPSNSRLTLSGSHFTSSWTASGQIPVRAVERGMIGRFGAIDDTEGGETSRSNLNARYTRPVGSTGLFTAQAYASHYDFELFSNFTFFLNDPVNGDQIVQREDRWLGGGLASYHDRLMLGQREVEYTVGVQTRIDRTDDSELTHSANRTEVIDRIKFGDIAERTASAFASASTDLGEVETTLGVRYDATQFRYTDALSGGPSHDEYAGTLNPSLQLKYSPTQKIQTFLKLGSGYHANDARLVSGGTELTFMPRAYGVDFGAVIQASERTVLSATLWGLHSEQEFVYVGDAGIVEPSGRSRRVGIDAGVRSYLCENFSIGGDVSIAHARAIDEPADANRIPLAPPVSAELFAIYQPLRGFHASARTRILADRPANEDYSITAPGYEVVDVTAGYTWKTLTLDLIVDNLFDVEWNETQFATESRLRNEPAPVEEIHFTPGVPSLVRARVSWVF